jgi:two-component system LytT family response regulator
MAAIRRSCASRRGPMRALEIVIVDDEPVALRRLAALLRDLRDVVVAGTAGHAAEALELVRRLSPDLVLLDIEMPGMSGIVLADQLRALPGPPAVIFITAFGRFALAAFEVAATDYLLKPVEPARLAEAIERVRGQRSERHATDRIAELEQLVSRLRAAEQNNGTHEGKTLWLPSGGGQDRVAVDEIVLVEAERDYVRVHTAHKSYFLRGRLGEMEQRLGGSGMVRVHRSAMVRATAITRVEAQGDRGYRLTLAGGTVVPASRRFGARVRALLGGASA